MRLPRSRWLLTPTFATLLCAGGCRPAPPDAPTELDDLVHFFLQHVDSEDAELVGAGAVNLAAWFDTADVVDDGRAAGQLSDVTQAELDSFEDLRWEPDPSLPVGVYTARQLDCTLEQFVAVYLEPDQRALFPDNYVDYERSFDSDPDCFRDDTCDQLDYHSTNTDKLVGFTMVYEMRTRLRRFHHDDAGGGSTQVVLARNVMPEPADEEMNAGGYEQSYHIEAHVPLDATSTLHLYGLWNHGYVEGISGDLDFWPNQYLDGLIELDDQIQVLCDSGAV